MPGRDPAAGVSKGAQVHADRCRAQRPPATHASECEDGPQIERAAAPSAALAAAIYRDGCGGARFEFTAENPKFPVRARENLDRYVAALGQETLSRLDAYMRRREVARKPGERTMRVGIGMQKWERESRRTGPAKRPRK